MKKFLTLFFVLFLSACSFLKPEYSVKFIVDNTTILEATYSKNDLIVKPTDPIKEGFDFDGWFDGNLKWDFEKDTLKNDLTLEAKFTEIKLIVRFFVDNDIVKQEIYTKNNSIIKPTDPIKVGFVFIGWYIENVKWNFESDVIITNIDLKAEFEEIEFTINFLVDGISIKEEKYFSDDFINKPQDPDKEGYIFDGWFNGEEKWNFETDVVASNLNLTAKFTEIEYIDENLNVDNVSLIDGILTWDTVNDADKYKIFVNDTFLAETTTEYFDLIDHKELFTQEKTLKLIAIKGNYESASPKQLKIKFVSDKENVEAYYTGLENDTRGSYLKGEIDLDDSTWYFDDALLGALANDKKAGIRAIRMRSNYIETKFSVENVSAITFSYASYGTEASNTLKLYAKSETSEWVELVSLTTTSELQQHTFNNFSTYFSEDTNIYFKFEISNERTVNIDEISIYHTIKGGWASLPISDLLSYYDGAEQLTGKNLFDFLNIRLNTDSNLVSYATAKEALEFADVHPTQENKVLTIYSREAVKGNWGTRSDWHREHVWPNSRLGIERVKESGVNQASDLHNLRAIIPSINSSRSNRYYTNATTPEYQTVGANMYYPGDADRGDVARILFYMVIVYDVLKLSDTVLSNTENPNYEPEGAVMGQLSILLAWHLADPVDDFERNRNEIIFEYQGNRNPFIDQPEWFETIYNYLVSIDEGSNALTVIEVEYQINYSEFTKKREYLI